MSAINCSDDAVRKVGSVLADGTKSLAERFRALFTLKNIGGAVAVNSIAECFSDKSALLKHECAYCLGQMANHPGATAVLERLLQDTNVETIVRHEAGEAIAALGDIDGLKLLEKCCDDNAIEVAETCCLGVARLQWLHDDKHASDRADIAGRVGCGYTSIDPAPPALSTHVPTLAAILLDESADLFTRYRAMFALRNVGDAASIEALCVALSQRPNPHSASNGVLFRHEVAYVLGQLQSELSVTALTERLTDDLENDIVRHECADALGSVGTDACRNTLVKYSDRSYPALVHESCEVAIDMWEHENSQQFQYADTLQNVNKE